MIFLSTILRSESFLQSLIAAINLTFFFIFFSKIFFIFF